MTASFPELGSFISRHVGRLHFLAYWEASFLGMLGGFISWRALVLSLSAAALPSTL